jgi:hypothetical protein
VYADHMTHTTTNAHQAEVDGRIAEAHVAYAKAAQNAAWFKAHAKSSFRGEEQFAEAVAKRDDTLAALSAVEAEYEGWSRFFLVQASNGHIHKSMWCTTCFPTTQYAWLPELSGLTEDEAVAEYGGILCSICFPSAPVEWTTGTNKKDAQRKADEAAMKAIAKTPEGKAVVRKRDLVRSSEYALRSIQRRIDRKIYTEKYDYTEDRMVPCSTEEIAAQQQENDEALAEREVVEKKMAKAQAQLDVAEAALNAALGI